MKMIKITLAVMILMIGTTGMVHAAAVSTATGETSITVGTAGAPAQTTLNSSSNVMMTYNGDAQSYGITTQHLNGTRIFGSGSGSPAIYYTETGKTAGTNTASDPTSVFSAGSWTAM